MRFTTLYFAYGANTNVAAMARRCPKAQPLGPMNFKDYKLVFRGVADIVPCKGEQVFGALWRITDECEQALDAFEGFPNLYTKIYGELTSKGKTEEVMMYAMTPEHHRGTGAPSATYEATLRQGYCTFGLPQSQIDDAIAAAKNTFQRHGRWSVKPSLAIN